MPDAGLHDGAPDADDGRVLEHCWAIRYSDPAALRDLLARLGPSPERRVLRAFADARAHRFDDALTGILEALDSGGLDARWTPRALNIQALILDDLGLQDEAFECQMRELAAARHSDDPIALAAVVHDLGVTYQGSDPERARRQYLEAIDIARSLRGRDAQVDGESRALEALAVLNIRELHADYDLGPVPDLPSAQETVALAATSWPELAAAIEAQRALDLLPEPAVGRAADPAAPGVDVEAAREIVETLPDPATMRDVMNAANVVRALARLARYDGRTEDGVHVVCSMIDRTPSRQVVELLDELIGLHEDAGHLHDALVTARWRAKIVVETHASDAQTAVRALEVWHRTRRAEEAAATHLAQAAKLRAQMTELHHDRETLRARSHRDVLTGLWNRQHLHDTVRTLDPTQPHQVAVIDIDHFKTVNDTNGHTIGDDVLRRLADALHDVAGPHDTCVRYGGDEIIVIRPATAPGHLAHDLAVITHLPPHDALALPAITTSIGIARTTTTFRDALDHADQLMYTAKRSGGGILLDDPTGDPAADPAPPERG